MTDPVTPPARPERDRLFGPVLLLGLLGSGLLAIAGHRDWLEFVTTSEREGALSIFRDAHPGIAQAPAAGAAGLVALAAWGALLVTRGVVRRGTTVLGVIAAAGALAAWFQARAGLQESVLDRADSYGFGGSLELEWTVWTFVAVLGALMTLVASGAALVRVGRWPAMGSRYDNPAVRSEAERSQAGLPVQSVSETDPTALWKALDEGQDPT